MQALGVDRADAAARTAATEHRKAERVKTLPISKQPWQQARSVMSLPASQVGELAAGDRLEVGGDFEVTVCLKPNPRHPGSGTPCVGKMYGFSPTVKAKIVLAPTEGATSPATTKTISRTVGLKCRQNHPVRNHHCVVSVPWSKLKVSDPSTLPCAPGSCTVNMVATAYHSDAGGDHRVVVGSSNSKGRINQGLGKLNSVRHRPGDATPAKVWRGGRTTKKLRVKGPSQGPGKKVVYSAKVSRLKAGDQLVVDALPKPAIGHLPYNVFQRTEVILAKNRKSTQPFGKVTESNPRISAENGHNCTQGKSAHSRICSLRKTGVLSIGKNAKGPFYVNVVVGQHAIGTSTSVRKWSKKHRSKIKKGGYVKVMRYRGAGACSTCSTGWTDFNRSSGRAAKLVSQLEQFGITNGSFNCAGRTNGDYICKWRAQGRFGDSPKYSCDTRTTWNPKRQRFNLEPCKDAMAAQLWNELLLLPQTLGIEPTFTGVCEKLRSGDFRCKWYADVVVGPFKGDRSCKGFGTYKIPEHRWVIDPCRV